MEEWCLTLVGKSECQNFTIYEIEEPERHGNIGNQGQAPQVGGHKWPLRSSYVLRGPLIQSAIALLHYLASAACALGGLPFLSFISISSTLPTSFFRYCECRSVPADAASSHVFLAQITAPRNIQETGLRYNFQSSKENLSSKIRLDLFFKTFQ